MTPPLPQVDRRLALDTVRTVTLRMTPLLGLMYLIADIDRQNISCAKLQMVGDLSLSESAYGLGASLFFLGYFLFEVPSNVVTVRSFEVSNTVNSFIIIIMLRLVTAFALWWVARHAARSSGPVRRVVLSALHRDASRRGVSTPAAAPPPA
ncbi:hypothetical protein AIGOOFII_2508 [Methylobacterium marchantiae]|nr:hypothetical protein AIGOOFII_2508 [Methylobacterium marchantiae]